ncbi:PGC-1 and ERR-induced regulator in muscle protein 1 isoform X1 [Monodelphis domestica]|uniref:PGC-1 and ERR-induced regulator in muscle protein 1 isoform X1 n=1 Tax=Monodelphis domestica TaxID=13616 RepID=UPI0024E20EB5|nr:PGC-1 and ERR-induced regulator in muscle protein 1 isoform X1 [Monodelphis domestica]
MENFEYSIQLSDKDWADFSDATEECGLLQAALASGDEPLSSDIDQGDSSGSSPPGPPPPRLFRVRAGSPLPEGLLKALGRHPLPGHLAIAQGGCSGSEEEESPDSRLVSRFRCERVLAPGAGQQTQRTSTQLEEQLPSSVLSPEQLSPALVPLPSPRGSRMQKSLQEAAAQASEAGVHSGKDPPSQEQPSSLGSPEGKRSPREPNPGTSPRSPGKKKRRSVGAKGSGSPKAQGPPSPSPALPPSSGIQPDRGPRSRAHGNLAPAAWAGNDPGSTFPVKGAGDGVSRGPVSQDASSAPDEDPKLSPAPSPEAGVNGSAPVPPEQSFVDVSSPVSKTQVNMSTPAWVPEASENLSTPASQDKLREDVFPNLAAPASEPENRVSARVLLAKADAGPAAPVPRARLDATLSAPAPQGRPDVRSSGANLESSPEANLPTSAPGARPDRDPSLCTPLPQGLPEGALSPQGGPLLEADDTAHPAEAVPAAQAPRRKKVRFSGISTSSPESPGPAAPTSPEPPRTLGGGRGGPRPWDAVAVGLHPQPRILKQPSAPSAPAKGSAGPREDFALTLPEAYDYFFCDTIVEEDEEDEDEEEGDIPEGLQWPEVCEYFFRDSHLPGRRGPPAPPPHAATLLEAVPITTPELYEHFFGEDGPSSPPRVPEEQSPQKAEELGLTVSVQGEQRAPLIPFTFNQNDMCLGFVAFATWAVRTSDLHAPDAWKTVLLANIGAISAIRHFRRQTGEGRPCP